MCVMNESPKNLNKPATIDSTEPRQWRCPICGDPLDPAIESAPFCSQRCKLVDLGKWLNGSYTISRDLKDADLE